MKCFVCVQGDGNSTGTGNPPGYCYKEQPSWSLYREPSFGHGTLDIVNSTHALWYVSSLLHDCFFTAFSALCDCSYLLPACWTCWFEGHVAGTCLDCFLTA